jgi:leucyl/phenylalanyl-tRNA--protein transferase
MTASAPLSDPAANGYVRNMAEFPEESDNLYLPIDAVQAVLPADLGLAAPQFFPPPTATTSDGLLCIGGRLAPEWLLDSYRHGIFPWPMWEDEPIAWWSPDPRAIIELDDLHVSRRLRRILNSARFCATCNRDFAGVIHGCATAAGREEGTWLTPTMIAAYRRMHELGHAHSVEVWHADSLAGGVYGVAIGGLFAAESMFYRESSASKAAVVYLVNHLRARGYQLLDIQQWTPHTGRLGAIEIPRLEYLRRLADVVDRPVTFGDRLAGK